MGAMKISAALVAGVAVALAGCAGPLISQRHQVPVTLPGPATLTGELYLPRGTGPFPTLILLHGCSGVGANIVGWAQWLQWEGYAALVLDSFGGRGLQRVCGDGSVFSGSARSSDRYPDVRLRGFVAFYPACGNVGSYRARPPLLILHGAADDWTPAEPCRYLAEAARGDGRDVTFVLYPGAHHAFDVTTLARPTRVLDARGGRGATIAYDPAARRDAEKRLREFLRRHFGR